MSANDIKNLFNILIPFSKYSTVPGGRSHFEKGIKIESSRYFAHFLLKVIFSIPQSFLKS